MGIAFIVSKKWKSKIYKLWKVGHRTPVLQLARSTSNKQKETENMNHKKMLLNHKAVNQVYAEK